MGAKTGSYHSVFRRPDSRYSRKASRERKERESEIKSRGLIARLNTSKVHFFVVYTKYPFDYGSERGQKMTEGTQTAKRFCQHTGTGEIYVIEMTWNRIVVGSYGPLQVDDLKLPDSYDCTTELNAWLETQKDKLVMI